MFGGPAEPTPEVEIRQGEVDATRNVQLFTVACAVLWLSPHVVDWARKMF